MWTRFLTIFLNFTVELTMFLISSIIFHILKIGSMWKDVTSEEGYNAFYRVLNAKNKNVDARSYCF